MAKKYTADTFEGALTGTASGNVSRTGDTGMTGNYSTTGSITAANGLKLNSSQQIFNYSNQFHIYSGGGTDIYLGGGIASMQNDVLVENGYIYTGQGLRVGGTGTANELDDYEEGTFDLGFVVGQFGGAAVYTLADFGGTKSETTKYVKIGRLVMVTSRFRYGTKPAAWPTSGTSAALYMGNLPFLMQNYSTGNTASGNIYAFPGLGSIGSPSLYTGSYSSNDSLIGFHSSTIGFYGNFQTIYPYNLPSAGPSGFAELQISFSYYTNS